MRSSSRTLQSHEGYMYCEYEGSNRPDSEFDVYPTFGLIHARQVATLHTIAGDEVEPTDTPLPPDYDLPLPFRVVEIERGE